VIAEQKASPAERLAVLAISSGTTLAVAESLTAGMVCAALADVPGVSAVLRGGVVAYATDTKTALLGVDATLLDAEGPVHENVAAQMAEGARDRLGADLALATTGVAGPGPHEGVAAGTVVVAVADGRGTEVRRLQLSGDRQAVRRGAAEAVIGLALEHLERVRPTPNA
jgi:nicotinamide-nucleotide amidase